MKCKHDIDINKNTICGNCQQEEWKKEGFRVRRILAKIIPFISSIGGMGCECCGMQWYVTKMHDVDYGNGSGSFAICESCWDKLTVMERLGFYRQVWEKYWSEDRNWETIENAILGNHLMYINNSTLRIINTIEENQIKDYITAKVFPKLP